MNGDGLYPESSRSLDDLWQMRLLLLLNDMDKANLLESSPQPIQDFLVPRSVGCMSRRCYILIDASLNCLPCQYVAPTGDRGSGC